MQDEGGEGEEVVGQEEEVVVTHEQGVDFYVDSEGHVGKVARGADPTFWCPYCATYVVLVRLAEEADKEPLRRAGRLVTLADLEAWLAARAVR